MVLGLALILLALLANEWTLRAWLGAYRIHSPSSRLLVGFGNLLLLAAGASFLLLRRKQAVFRAALGVFFLGMLAVMGLVGLELYLQTSHYLSQRPAGAEATAAKYDAFCELYLHPFYHSFFPRDPAVIERLNNEIVSIDRNGFRGPGPEQKGNRRLAFLLGGSAVFGYGNSSNDTTISGYLNALQNEYHVVNAGVLGWNSNQEFYRLALELLPYRPDLVLVYDGFNDAAWTYYQSRSGKRLPPGTPILYKDIERWEDQIRKPRLVALDLGQLRHLQAVLTLSAARRAVDRALSRPIAVDSRHARRTRTVTEPDPALVEQAGQVYVRNLVNMNHLARGYGARLMVFWQPVFSLHRNTSSEAREAASYPDATRFKQRFHDYVFAHRPAGVEVMDLSNVFDPLFQDISQAGVFQAKDDVHLTDRGNEIVAREMLRPVGPK